MQLRTNPGLLLLHVQAKHPCKALYGSVLLDSDSSNQKCFSKRINLPQIIYTFRCCSLETSHPRFLPESKSLFYTSVSLFLFCIQGYRWMPETSAQTWCTGKTQRDQVEREVGGGIGMGNTCISKADSCQCMTKTTTIL